ncbi:MAG: 3-oxoacyl-ACP synthase [Bacteroidota bacterium]
MSSNKAQLHTHCIQLLNERIAKLEAAAATVREARNNETKSSAGDKYETGRAMMQQEEDKLLAQQDAARQMLLQLRQLKPEQIAKQASPGSLVQTNARTYYLGISLGKVIFAGQTYFCVSTEAPISKVLLGKTVGDTIQLNGREERVLSLA